MGPELPGRSGPRAGGSKQESLEGSVFGVMPVAMASSISVGMNSVSQAIQFVVKKNTDKSPQSQQGNQETRYPGLPNPLGRADGLFCNLLFWSVRAGKKVEDESLRLARARSHRLPHGA